jgi:Fe-S cluster biogenesis protein NfuA
VTPVSGDSTAKDGEVGGAVASGLQSVRQRLRSHGGDLRVLDISAGGEVSVEFVGACRGCPALAFTYSAVVHPALESVDGVTAVTSRQVQLSPHVARRLSEFS